MLTEKEWKEVGPLLQMDTEAVKALRKDKGIGLKEALEEHLSKASDKYYEITGYRETNWQAIWHRRLSDYGPECPSCGHLFRTPNATFCANCGYKNRKEDP